MYRVCKGIGDRVFAFLGIIILIPLFVIVTFLIHLDGHGKPVFRQERVGKDQKPFLMFKFRTMKACDVPFDVDHAVIESDDRNVTKLGRVIRRLKIDELLQLFNVLRGEMSLVGPRPLKAEYLATYEPWEFGKHDVKPGMTGLAQVNGNGYLSNRDRSYYDVYYARHYGLWMDIKILFRTVAVIFCGEKHMLKPVTPEQLAALQEELDK